jgi:transposase InsO family protein
VRTYEGWLYLAVVIDLFSRRVVGWSIQSSLHTDIVLSALTMAVGQRLPGPGLLQHSDRGSVDSDQTAPAVPALSLGYLPLLGVLLALTAVTLLRRRTLRR